MVILITCQTAALALHPQSLRQGDRGLLYPRIIHGKEAKSDPHRLASSRIHLDRRIVEKSYDEAISSLRQNEEMQRL
jgi:hypothetical protein